MWPLGYKGICLATEHHEHRVQPHYQCGTRTRGTQWAKEWKREGTTRDGNIPTRKGFIRRAMRSHTGVINHLLGNKNPILYINLLGLVSVYSKGKPNIWKIEQYSIFELKPVWFLYDRTNPINMEHATTTWWWGTSRRWLQDNEGRDA